MQCFLSSHSNVVFPRIPSTARLLGFKNFWGVARRRLAVVRSFKHANFLRHLFFTWAVWENYGYLRNKGGQFGAGLTVKDMHCDFNWWIQWRPTWPAECWSNSCQGPGLYICLVVVWFSLLVQQQIVPHSPTTVYMYSTSLEPPDTPIDANYHVLRFWGLTSLNYPVFQVGGTDTTLSKTLKMNRWSCPTHWTFSVPS